MALPWNSTCKVVGCGEPALLEAPFELCGPHMQGWKHKVMEYTQPVHPWRIVMGFERWCVTEGRKLQLVRSMEKLGGKD